MKSLIKVALLIALGGSLFSCKKSSDSPSSSSVSFQAKFDGSQKNLSTQVIVMKTKLAEDMYNLTITGVNKTEQGAITLWSDKDDFTAGKTFDIPALDGTTENSFSFASPLGSSAPTSIWATSYSYGAIDQHFTCTLTESTSTYVKGTFSAVIYQNDDSKVVKQTISEGSFYAKY